MRKYQELFRPNAPWSPSNIASSAGSMVCPTTKVRVMAGGVTAKDSEQRATAIFAAVGGAQLMARGRSDIALYDALIDSYRSIGLLI